MVLGSICCFLYLEFSLEFLHLPKFDDRKDLWLDHLTSTLCTSMVSFAKKRGGNVKMFALDLLLRRFFSTDSTTWDSSPCLTTIWENDCLCFFFSNHQFFANLRLDADDLRLDADDLRLDADVQQSVTWHPPTYVLRISTVFLWMFWTRYASKSTASSKSPGCI